MKLSFQPSAVLAAAVLQTAPAHGESTLKIDSFPVSEVGYETMPLNEDILLPDDAGDSGIVMEIPLQETQEWNKNDERRFLNLAQREALGTLAPADKVELEKLSALRYQMKTPRSGEQVVLEFQQRKMASDLVHALEKYVAFQKAASYPRK